MQSLSTPLDLASTEPRSNEPELGIDIGSGSTRETSVAVQVQQHCSTEQLAIGVQGPPGSLSTYVAAPAQQHRTQQPELGM